MNGRTMLRLFADAMGADGMAALYGAGMRSAYEALDWAAAIFCREALPLKLTTDITTVLDQQDYALPPDFIELYARDRGGRYRVKYIGEDDGVSWPYFVPDEKILFADLTTATSAAPDVFSLINQSAAGDEITGTAASDAEASRGESLLYDTTKDFAGTDRVYPRDAVHNLTDGSSGYVLQVVDAHTLAVALFPDPVDAANLSPTNLDGSCGFESGHSYSVMPSSQTALRLSRPAGYSGHTLRIPYHGMPLPVFAESRAWRWPERTCRAIVSGAASIVKQPDKKNAKEVEALAREFASEVARVRVEVARQALNHYNTRQPNGR
jgi:hypothetical protein